MSYTTKKIDDHKWEIDFLVGDPVTEVSLLDVELNLLEILSFEDTSVNVDLVEYGDGTYLIKFVRTSLVEEYVPIFDLTDSFACYKALFAYILCSCDDPCNDCDDGIREREYDMNSIMALMINLKEMIYLEKYQYMGIYSVNDTRESLLGEIGAMIDKLQIISDRCGLCDENSTNSITNCE